MTVEELVRDVFARFSRDGEWPLVKSLQLSYAPSVNVRRLASESNHRVLCDFHDTGRCSLPLDTVFTLAETETVLGQFVSAVAYAARRYVAGASSIPDHEFAEALGLDATALRRLGTLLFESSHFAGGSRHPETGQFSVNLAEELLFFREVQTRDDYEAAVQRLRDDRDAMIRGHVGPEPKPLNHGSNDSVAASHRAALVDPALERILSEDLIELETLLNIGAWKSAAILAGSCLEAVLLDLCSRPSNQPPLTYQKKLPSQLSSGQLLALAVQSGLIRSDHKDLGGALKRWRDLVHPFRAAHSSRPTQALAHALNANLRLLLSDLAQSEPRSRN